MKRFWIRSTIVVLCCGKLLNDAAAQSETYSAAAVSEQGGRFTLVIHRTGNRLKFDITAQSAQTSLSGVPRCESVELRPDGTFLTHCGGFQAQDADRYRLEGNLQAARIDTVFRFGRAEFTLLPGPLPTAGRR